MAYSLKLYWNSGTDTSPVWTEVTSGNIIKMVVATYDTSTPINQYQERMHLQTSLTDDTDACINPHLTSIKYINPTRAQENDEIADELGTSFPAQTRCLKFALTDGSTPITTLNTKLFFYNGTNVAVAPTSVTGQGIEQGKTQWTQCGGQGNAMVLDNHPILSVLHEYFVGISCSPTAIGTRTAVLRFTTDYNDGSGAVTIYYEITIILPCTYCDNCVAGHILETIAVLSPTMMPSIKEATIGTLDPISADAINVSYASARKINGVVIPDPEGYFAQRLREMGIEIKSTPILLVPITCNFTIGSRVFDPITQSWYELREVSDQLKHFDEYMGSILNYRQYELKKISDYDGGGV